MAALSRFVPPGALAFVAVAAAVAAWLWLAKERLEAALAEKEAAIAACDAAIARQNAHIEQLRQAAAAAASNAAAAARRELLAGTRARAALPPGHGPEPLNAWLQETFAR